MKVLNYKRIERKTAGSVCLFRVFVVVVLTFSCLFFLS